MRTDHRLCRREGFPLPYLGLPLSANKLPVSTFIPYIQKSDKYLSSWQANLLNPMGRTVLVNSVLDSLLVYFNSALLRKLSVYFLLRRWKIWRIRGSALTGRTVRRHRTLAFSVRCTVESDQRKQSAPAWAFCDPLCAWVR